jgi:hypothetical protein
LSDLCDQALLFVIGACVDLGISLFLLHCDCSLQCPVLPVGVRGDVDLQPHGKIEPLEARLVTVFVVGPLQVPIDLAVIVVVKCLTDQAVVLEEPPLDLLTYIVLSIILGLFDQTPTVVVVPGSQASGRAQELPALAPEAWDAARDGLKVEGRAGHHAVAQRLNESKAHDAEVAIGLFFAGIHGVFHARVAGVSQVIVVCVGLVFVGDHRAIVVGVGDTVAVIVFDLLDGSARGRGEPQHERDHAKPFQGSCLHRGRRWAGRV